MSYQEYLDDMKKIQNFLLDFFENDNKCYEDIYAELNIHEDKYKLKSICYLILRIANNHHRSPIFFTQIEKILTLFKDDFRKYFSNVEVFNIFKSNKRILLFLFDEKMINIDESIYNAILNEDQKNPFSKYLQYFYPEIKPFQKSMVIKENYNSYNYDENEEEDHEVKLPDNFFEKRKIGENHNLICRLIRNDQIDEFVVYVTKTNLKSTDYISNSIYETNLFLMNDYITIIEYAAFFGSIQILQYLLIDNGSNLLNQSIWKYAIHGQNPELIHLIEREHVEIYEDQCFTEAIICHHNEIANYIQNHYIANNDEKQNFPSEDVLQNYNFEFIDDEFNLKSNFSYLCLYDYYILVKALINEKEIDPNGIIIF